MNVELELYIHMFKLGMFERHLFASFVNYLSIRHEYIRKRRNY